MLTPFQCRTRFLFSRSTIFGKTSDLKREQLHLFVCDIECDIFPGKDGDQYKPSTYACLVSSPEEVLLAPPTLFEQCCNSVKKFLHINKSSVDIDITSGGNAPTGWPRTPVIKDKLNPKWGQQDIHCILRRHHEDGQPLNLSGAILHLFIFKYNNRHPDEVIGSCPINLELLFRAVAKTDGLSPNPARDSFRKSRSGLFADRTDEQFRIETNDDNIVSMEVNGPLLKNGNQHGVIRCTLDAWWVDEALAGGVSSKPLEMEEGIEDFSEHSQILLSDRIRSGKRKKNHR